MGSLAGSCDMGSLAGSFIQLLSALLNGFVMSVMFTATSPIALEVLALLPPTPPSHLPSDPLYP
ncbi:TPA: hypothetical protein ACH3X1_015026 [Trebouxia sp. C0004]